MTKTTKTPASRQPRKPARTASLTRRTPDAAIAVLTLTVGEDRTRFYVTEHSSDCGGRLFKLVKHADDCRGDDDGLYYVHVSDSEPSCECKGWARWGHKTVCKHLASLKALISAGKL